MPESLNLLKLAIFLTNYANNILFESFLKRASIVVINT